MYCEPISRQGENSLSMLRGLNGLCGGRAFQSGGADIDPYYPPLPPLTP